MAEEPGATQEERPEEGGEEKKPGKKKLVLFGLIGLVVLAGGGGAAYFMGMFDSGPAAPLEAAAPAPEPVYFYELPELTVNLSSIDDGISYLKMRIALELTDEKVVKQIEPYMPRILDTFQVYLRELRVTDLRGSSGLFRLKEELQRRINIAVYPAKVNDVLFKELLIQ